MFSLIFDSCFIQVTLLRMCSGLLFAVLAVAAQIEKIASELEILTIEGLHSVTDLADTLGPEPLSQEHPDSEQPGYHRLSFSPQLRFESKNQRLEIKPRRNSLRLLWRKSFR